MLGCSNALLCVTVFALLVSLKLSWHANPNLQQDLQHAATTRAETEEDGLLPLHLGPDFVAVGFPSASPEFEVQWDVFEEGEEEDDSLLGQEAFNR
jgi:hypothetical protein